MKTNLTINRKPGLLWLLMIFCTGLTGCIHIDYFPCEKPRLADLTESRQFTTFTGVDVQLGAEVQISRGGQYALEITAPENFLDLIDTRVNGQTLKISTDRCLKCEPGDIRIHITLPAIDHLKLSGSGFIELMDPFEGSQMDIDLYGSGNIYAGLLYDYLSSRITGSGDIVLSGINGHHDALITGSGNLVGFPLQSHTAEVTITGSGDASLTVRDQLKARITGSGSIYLRGDPLVQSTVTGTGAIVGVY